MLVQRTIIKEVNKCYGECLYFGILGGVTVCEFAHAEDLGYIISHAECDNGFPEKCPLIKLYNELEIL